MCPRSTISWPQRVTTLFSIGRLASGICPAPAASGSGTTSSPVDRIATRSRRRTVTLPTPTDARSPMSPGEITRPAVNISVPAATSSAAGLVLAPGFSPREKATVAPSPVTSSSRTMVSTPCGTAAPVRMRNACPGGTTPAKGCPAAARPSHNGKRCGASPRLANANPYPSTAELVNGGWFRAARTPDASTRPTAASMASSRVPTTHRRPLCNRASASSTGVQSTPGGKAKQSLRSGAGSCIRSPFPPQ